MSANSAVVQSFLENYERSRNSFDPELIDAQYLDAFMFAGPDGVKAADKAGLLASVAKGKVFLASIGHKSTKLVSSADTTVDEHYRMVRARFAWRFEKAPADPIDVELDTMFILFLKDGVARIVFQQEHEDFLHALRARGVVPPAA